MDVSTISDGMRELMERALGPLPDGAAGQPDVFD